MSLKKRSIEGIVLKVGATALTFALHALIGNYFGASGYGEFSFALVIAILLSEISTLGWSRSITRFLVAAKESNNISEYCGIVKKSHLQTIATSLLASFLCYLLYYYEKNSELQDAILFGGILIVFYSLNAIRKKIFIVENSLRSAIIPVDIAFPGILVLIILLFTIENVNTLLTSAVATHFLILVVSSILLIKAIPCRSSSSAIVQPGSHYTTTSLVVLIGVIGQLLLSRTDLLLIGFMMDSSQFGIYSAAARIARLSPFFLGVLTLVFSPKLASAYVRNDIAEFKKLLMVSIGLSAMLSLPVFLLCILTPELLLGFFGDDFLQASSVLMILAIGQFINAITGPVANALLVTGHEKVYSSTYTIFAILGVFLNYLCIQRFGILGAAFATSAIVALLNITQLIYVWNRIYRQRSIDA